MACRAAVKAGDRLTRDQVRLLLAEAEEAEGAIADFLAQMEETELRRVVQRTALPMEHISDKTVLAPTE